MTTRRFHNLDVALNALARIRDNLASVGLTMRDVIALRVSLDNPPRAATMDCATIPQPIGTGAPGPPIVVNPVRPSRTVIEVANLPVPGWLVEIEAVAKRPSSRHAHGR